MIFNLYGGFTENNPRLSNPHEDKKYKKASEGGLYELSEGIFGFTGKDFESLYFHW